jgi:flagellar biosynthesis regulator FlbT
MKSFTQGNWTIDNENGGLSIASKNDDGEIFRFMCDMIDDFIPQNEVLANARLIANAPEMYDELYEALQLIKGTSSYEGDMFDQQAKSIQELLDRIDND